MINPSHSGWINKFFVSQKMAQVSAAADEMLLYKNIRQTGIIYGHVVSFENISDFDTKKWTPEELTKIALLVALYHVFTFRTNKHEPELFIENVVGFYKKMNPDGFNLLKKLLPENKFATELEDILEERVQTNDNILTRNFSHILTNALLFEDILAYNHFLENSEIALHYIKNLEETIIGLISFGLNIKETKSSFNDLLIKLLESSFRFTKFSNTDDNNFENLDFSNIKSNLEKFYLIDLAVLALWNESQDGSNTEKHFLKALANRFQIEQNFVADSVLQTNLFLTKFKSEIPYFKYSNPVKHFYGNMTDAVKVLIERNRTRFTKELVNNRELASLISQAAIRNLDTSEKKKIKKQLLEICRTVPSLAVFMLPGGSLLLPLLIKFIPKMLPTAFNENLETDSP